MDKSVSHKAIRRRGLPRRPLIALIFFMAIAVLVAPTSRGDSNNPDIVILWNGVKLPARNAALLSPPGVEHELHFSGVLAEYDVRAAGCDGYAKCSTTGGTVFWQAPLEPGNYELDVTLELSPWPRDGEFVAADGVFRTETVTIICLIGYPSSMMEEGHLNGFKLGDYPDWENMNNPELYRPPEFFFKVDKSIWNRNISENVLLRNLGYDCRSGFPQYSSIHYELVWKLEAILDELEARGLPAKYYFIGGGYISPRSNKIRTSRNRAAASLSRHMWGEAVDFIIDTDRNAKMDDVDGNGVIDVRDAFLVRDVITDLERSGRVVTGGVGVYSPPRNSRIQLHVDVRGFESRWGIKEYDPEIFASIPAGKSIRPGGR